MIKKINILASLLFLAATLSLSSQERQDWDKIKSLKIAFITERLNLTPKEAQSFWPIYNEHQSKRESLFREERFEIGSEIKNLDALSDTKAVELLARMQRLEEEKYKVEKSYIEKISKTISAKKTILLMRSEEDFKRQLIKQYRQKKGGQ
ncbi:hypothetical protein SAMN03080594_102735 [Arenibacter palladensis]|mgnify:CR=1 FL=1|uniref:Sensor of ECF-type sigma factor n=2 Tax=Arenibacter palladensis TaxID=237373 RepID=A0A1M4Z897_9FLAO|nr:hypothetical protein SAMN03080594_102735 [Arenibacter palladensis]